MTRPDLARAAFPLAWACLVLGLGRREGVVRRLPVLGVFDGPLGGVLLAGALVLAVAALLAPRLSPSPAQALARLSPRALFGAAFLVLAVLGGYYATSLRASGDEPHYLLMAQSLWREGDLDLQDNFEREDFREYTPGPVEPHYGAPRADGRPFPAHSPGLAVLLAAPYAVGGRAACVVVLALLGAWLSLEARAWAARSGATGEALALAWACALVSPALFYSFHVYTELPSAVAAAAALRWVDDGTRSPRPGRVIGAALLAGALPWLHVKMIPAAMVIGAFALLRLRGRALAAFLAAAAVPAAGLLFHYWRVFGVASPLALYGGMPRSESGDPVRALGGLLLDRSFGLLPHAPVYLLAIPGLFLLGGRKVWALLALGVAVLAPVLSWRMWWGGQCPPGRFLVPMVVVLAAAAALAASSGRGLARWRWPLLGLSGAIGLGMAAEPGALFLVNRGDRPTRLWSALAGSADPGRYLPSLVFADPEEVRVALVWAAALGALVALHAGALRRDGMNRLFGGLGLPLALLLAVGVAVDRWARPTAHSASAVSAAANSTGAGASAAAGPRAGPSPRPE